MARAALWNDHLERLHTARKHMGRNVGIKGGELSTVLDCQRKEVESVVFEEVNCEFLGTTFDRKISAGQ